LSPSSSIRSIQSTKILNKLKALANNSSGRGSNKLLQGCEITRECVSYFNGKKPDRIHDAGTNIMQIKISNVMHLIIANMEC